ncbi:hypothetical protein ACH5A2_01505 [Streptomyces collinus]|uniref:hypothetical protein n=1 Tax=Streptomyces collinus TaxID=42684 RepID=UPI00378D186C
MTVRGALAPRTHAAHGVFRWERAAVIALLAALAVLIHHETAPASIGTTASSAMHVMTPGMVMSSGHAAPATVMAGHGHGGTAGHAAEPRDAAAPKTSSADGPPCSGMAMEHCSTGSLEIVKLPVPAKNSVPWGLAAAEAVATGPKSAGRDDRAPPDLSVLSRLRI